MVQLIALGLWLGTGDAEAQVCVCTRNVALPGAGANRAGSLTLTGEYSLAQSGGPDSWKGLSESHRVDEVDGTSLPGHLVQTLAGDVTVGVTDQLSLQVTAPWTVITHLEPSEKPGDDDTSALSDMSVAARWGWSSTDEDSYIGISVGATLPTGKVVVDTPIRVGKGAVGGLASVQASRRLSPLFGLAATIGWQPTLFTPRDDYRVGSSTNLAAGTRFTPKEDSRLIFSAFGVVVVQQPDSWLGVRLPDSGVAGADLAVGAQWTVWERDIRSMALVGRGQVPLWQAVGAPWLVENWVVTAGVRIVAL